MEKHRSMVKDEVEELKREAIGKRKRVKSLLERNRNNESFSDEELLDAIPLLFDEIESLEIALGAAIDESYRNDMH